MRKQAVYVMILCLAAATAAHAQYGQGGQGGGGGRGGGRGARNHPAPAPSASAPAPAALKPVDTIQIIGVIRAIDPAHDRPTIDYEPVDALSWPAGSNAFVVSKTAMLQGAKVGEKVRFTLESQQIASLTAY